MILYLDTSSLIKLYVDEARCEPVRHAAAEAQRVVTCCVAYAEACAALERRRRSRDLDRASFDRSVAALRRQWPLFTVTEVDEVAAGDLALKHGLRGFDAIHLASAVTLSRAPEVGDLLFSSFDERLNEAAAAEGLLLLAL